MDKFKYGNVATAIQDVMAEPEKFIIPENRRIIEYLWDKKNILTKHTNDYNNKFSWIGLGELDEENSRIFRTWVNKKSGQDEREVSMFTTFKSISIPLEPGEGKDTFEAFKPLVDLLQIQDVQKDGYMTIDEFFTNYTDCFDYERVKRLDPKDLPVEPIFDDYNGDFDAFIKAHKEYDKLCDEIDPQVSVVKRYNPQKMTKTLMEYLEEFGFADCYDEEEGKIFYNKRLYEGHMRYKRSKSNGRKP